MSVMTAVLWWFRCLFIQSCLDLIYSDSIHVFCVILITKDNYFPNTITTDLCNGESYVGTDN